MTSSVVPTLFLCTCLLFCFCMVSQAELAIDCCLKVSSKEIPQRVLAGYELQYKDKGCDIDAVIFFTRKGMKLCAPTTEDWVKKATAKLDKMLEKCKSKKFQDHFCKRMKVVTSRQ